MRRGVLSTGSLVLAVVLLLAINILAATVLGGWRLDMTQNRLYTLSEGSRAVVRKLDEPITLNLFFSQRPCATCRRFRPTPPACRRC